MILLYRDKTRHKLIARFKTYFKVSRYIDNFILLEEQQYYFIVNTKVKRRKKVSV